MQVLKSGDKVDLWLSAKSIAEVDARSMQVRRVHACVHAAGARETRCEPLHGEPRQPAATLTSGSRAKSTPFGHPWC